MSMMQKLTSTGPQDAMSSLGLLILRLVSGIAMAAAHGWGKYANFGDLSTRFADPIGLGTEVSLALAVFAELVCAVLIAIGLTTRLAAIPLIITMLVAVVIIHGGDPFAKQELGLMYLAAYAAILFIGPGKFSVDALLNKRK